MILLLAGTARAADRGFPGWARLDVALVPETSPVDVIEQMSFKNEANTKLFSCVGFVNRGPQVALGIRFRFFQIGSYGDVLTSGDKLIDGNFAPNVPIKVKIKVSGAPDDSEGRCWQSFALVDKTQKIMVRVERVVYIDGSVWTSPSYGLATLH